MTQRAYYDPADDYINNAALESFNNSASLLCTLYMKLIHWTGHFSRLNRRAQWSEWFRSTPYSIEELTAEIGSCYLMSYTGILTSDISNTAAYIQAWLAKLRNDKRFIIYAAAEAQRAVDLF